MPVSVPKSMYCALEDIVKEEHWVLKIARSFVMEFTFTICSFFRGCLPG